MIDSFITAAPAVGYDTTAPSVAAFGSPTPAHGPLPTPAAIGAAVDAMFDDTFALPDVKRANLSPAPSSSDGGPDGLALDVFSDVFDDSISNTVSMSYLAPIVPADASSIEGAAVVVDPAAAAVADAAAAAAAAAAPGLVSLWLQPLCTVAKRLQLFGADRLYSVMLWQLQEKYGDFLSKPAVEDAAFLRCRRQELIRQTNVFEQITIPTMIFAHDLQPLFASPTACNMLGRTAASLASGRVGDHALLGAVCGTSAVDVATALLELASQGHEGAPIEHTSLEMLQQPQPQQPQPQDTLRKSARSGSKRKRHPVTELLGDGVDQGPTVGKRMEVDMEINGTVQRAVLSLSSIMSRQRCMLLVCNVTVVGDL